MPPIAVRALWLVSVVFGCSAGLQGCDADLIGPRQVGALHAELRPLAGMATEPPFFDASDRIEHYDSSAGVFRVHFTREGRHAVPDPDYPKRVADDFDRVLEFYKELGYREPVRDGTVPGEHGGDDRFDVYLLDFAIAGADGQFKQDTGCNSAACGGYMILENDFQGKGYKSLELAIRLVSSHELFHAVQQAYSHEIGGWLSEGTAVWASEAFDAEAGDLERQVPAYFERPESSLSEGPPGTDPIRYAGAIFYQFIDEHAGREALRRMFEILSDTGDDWPVALDSALHEQDSSLAEQYGSFVEWNLFTAERADPARSYAHGDELPAIKERDVEPGYKDSAVRVFPLAARYYTLRADAADSVIASATLSDDSGAEDLQLAIAIEHDGKITSVERAPNEAQRELSVKVARGDTAHVVLYNTATSGNSVRPDLCIATASTKKLCDADAEVETDAGAQDAAATAADSGGCSVLALPSDHPKQWLLISLGAAAAVVRVSRTVVRRRRRGRCR